jgi:hypothetical protein
VNLPRYPARDLVLLLVTNTRRLPCNHVTKQISRSLSAALEALWGFSKGCATAIAQLDLAAFEQLNVQVCLQQQELKLQALHGIIQ